MKSRTSFFDATVLKKDITRYLPVWLIYTIGGLLVALSVAGIRYEGYSFARNICSYVGPFAIINLCYGGLVALLLFGDLFNARLCNALHAMPVRREGWFLTHISAGLLFSLVPNLVIALAIMPALREFWYLALLWYLGMELHYLFFFLLGCFSCMCAGNRVAALAVYGIINFLALIVLWFVTAIYEPLIYGVTVENAPFFLFCPVVQLCREQNFFSVIHLGSCPCHADSYYEYAINNGLMQHQYEFGGMGDSWNYLLILVGIGLVFGLLALVLYRRRQLECAGDFMAFRPMQPVFAVIFCLCAGAMLEMVGELFMDEGNYIFGSIGLIVGFFVAQMLLRRTVKVFHWKKWLFLAGIAGTLVLSMVLTQADVLGIARWTPEKEEVHSITIAKGNYDQWNKYTDEVAYYDEESIQLLIDTHKLLIAEGPVDQRSGKINGLTWITVNYTMKDGRQIWRHYRAATDGPAMGKLNDLLFTKPSYALGAETLEELLSNTDYVGTQTYVLYEVSKDSLLSCVFEDAMAGRLFNTNGIYDGEYDYCGYVELCRKSGRTNYVEVYGNATKTAAWIKHWNLLMNIEGYIQKADSIRINDTVLTGELLQEFCAAWGEERSTGTLMNDKPATSPRAVVTLQYGQTQLQLQIREYHELLCEWLKNRSLTS